MLRASVCKAWVGAVALAASGAAPAAPLLVFGSTADPVQVPTTPPTFAVGGLAESARDVFLVSVGTVRRETVDALPSGYPDLDPAQGGSATPPAIGTLSLFSGSAVLRTPRIGASYGTLVRDDSSAERGQGRWDTTTYHALTDVGNGPEPSFGGRFLQSAAGFEIEFNQALSAFGTFITDAGDFSTALSVCFSRVSDAECDDVGSTALQLTDPASPERSGNLLFIGYSSPDAGSDIRFVRFAYSQVPAGGTGDVMGFDDLLIVERDVGGGGGGGGAAPEPAPLALLGLASLVLAASRRRPRPA